MTIVSGYQKTVDTTLIYIDTNQDLKLVINWNKKYIRPKKETALF